MQTPQFIYKVASRAVFEASFAAGRFTGMPIDLSDGYIHFSTALQLAETLRLHFAGQGDLMLFAIRCADHAAGLRWEPSRGGALFPHLYRELPMSAMVQSAPLAVAADGAVALPDWVR